MNKEKTLQIIERLQNIITERSNNPEYQCKCYVETWVLGTLSEIKVKIENVGVPFAVRNTTYSQLFREFINFFFCRNIDPAIRMYTIAVLFNIDTRDLIIELYKYLFDKKQRNVDSHSVGYIDFDDKWITKNSQFEIIRRAYSGE